MAHKKIRVVKAPMGFEPVSGEQAAYYTAVLAKDLKLKRGDAVDFGTFRTRYWGTKNPPPYKRRSQKW